MLKFLKRRWAILGIMIGARRAVDELRTVDERRMVENFFESSAWQKVVDISMHEDIHIKGSFEECMELYVRKGQLIFYECAGGPGLAHQLTVAKFYPVVTNPSISFYSGSVASVLRKFIVDVDKALFRLAY